MSDHGTDEPPAAQARRVDAVVVLHEVRNLLSVAALGLPDMEAAVEQLAQELILLRGRMHRHLGSTVAGQLLEGLERVVGTPPLEALRTEIVEQQQALRSTLRLLGSGLAGGAPTGCDPAEVVERMVQRLGPVAAPICLEARISAVPRVAMPAEDLQRVLLNLVRNAVSACISDEGRGNRIRLDVRTEDRAVLVAVEDDGPGVPAAVRRRLFKPFVSGGGEDRVGVGLHICWTLVRAAGGMLRHLDRPGGGARFELVLPPARREGSPDPSFIG